MSSIQEESCPPHLFGPAPGGSQTCQTRAINNNKMAPAPAVAKKSHSPFFAGGPFLRYKMDPIDHPVYGSASWCGDIPLLLPFRGHTREEILPDLAGCDRIAAELIEVGRAVWPDEDDDEVLAKLKEYTFSSFLMTGFGPSNRRHAMFTIATILIVSFDDSLDAGLDSMDEFGAGSYRQFTEQFRSSGLTSFFDRELPTPTVGMARMLQCWEKLKTDLLALPHYHPGCEQALVDELLEWGATIVLQADLKKAGLQFSEATQAALVRNQAGSGMFLEFVALLYDVRVPDFVRNDVLFQVARAKVADVATFSNALVGLKRDLKLGLLDSPILISVTSGRLSLQGAIEKVHADLVDAVHDLKLATDKLLEVYGEDENVRSYMHILVAGMDGILYTYKFTDRYGLADNLDLFEK